MDKSHEQLIDSHTRYYYNPWDIATKFLVLLKMFPFCDWH